MTRVLTPTSDGSVGRRKHRRGKRGSYNQVNADPDDVAPGQAIDAIPQARCVTKSGFTAAAVERFDRGLDKQVH